MVAQGELFGDREGERLREEGLKRVLANAGEDFRSRALASVATVAMAESVFTIEDVRDEFARAGYEEPHHHNAWGGILPLGASYGWIEGTDRFVKSLTPEAHARRVQVWKSRVVRRR